MFPFGGFGRKEVGRLVSGGCLSVTGLLVKPCAHGFGRIRNNNQSHANPNFRIPWEIDRGGTAQD